MSGGERAQRLQEPKPAGSRKDRIRSLEQTAVDWAHRVSLFVPACPNLAIVVFGFGTAKHRENCIFGLTHPTSCLESHICKFLLNTTPMF